MIRIINLCTKNYPSSLKLHLTRHSTERYQCNDVALFSDKTVPRQRIRTSHLKRGKDLLTGIEYSGLGPLTKETHLNKLIL